MNFSYCQTTLMLDKEKSNIKYSAKHVLHAWEGINNDVSGVAVYNESISKIALAAQVIDFDSGNSGRDSHSLEVLEALKFPNIPTQDNPEKIPNQTDTLASPDAHPSDSP